MCPWGARVPGVLLPWDVGVLGVLPLWCAGPLVNGVSGVLGPSRCLPSLVCLVHGVWRLSGAGHCNMASSSHRLRTLPDPHVQTLL